MPQFEENSEEYRCCCGCAHVRTGTMLIGIVECIFLLYFFVNALILIVQNKSTFGADGDSHDPFVLGPFIAAMVGVGIGFLVVFLLFLALCQKYAPLLMPHFVMQVIAIVCYLAVVISGIIGFSTHRSEFFRFMNAVPFMQNPNANTVNLSFSERTAAFIALIVYSLGFLLEIWWAFVVWKCYKYYSEKADYVRYCRSYSMPMKQVTPRNGVPVPHYSSR